MEEKFHLLIALTQLVTVNDWNIDTYYFICEPSEIQGVPFSVWGFPRFIGDNLIIRPYLLLVVYFKGHRVEASVTHNKHSSMNRNIELIVLLPEI